MDVVPEDLADLVHRAARATAPHRADLAAVRRRVRDGVGLVAHELATGRERTLVRAAKPGSLPFRTVAAAGLVVSVTAEPDMNHCRLEVRRLAGGARRSRPAVGGACGSAIRISPDGGLVAVPYTRPAGGRRLEHRVALLDTATGRPRADESIVTTDAVWGLPDGGIYGAAWIDGSALRVVSARLPDPARRVYTLAELARVVTVTAQ